MKFHNNFGTLIERKTFNVFFGNQKLNREVMRDLYPQATWLHQVHGHNVVETAGSEQRADGHYTKKIKQPLVIKTADCIPAFYLSNQHIIALHIGWRGLEQKILSHSIEKIPLQQEHELIIGPHIQMKSFDLDRDNLMTLLNSHKIKFTTAITNKIIDFSPNKSNHFLVNLSLILMEEAKKLGFKKFHISPINTFTSPDHYSYRRNRREVNRNYSFIIRK